MQLRWYSDGSIRWMRFLLTIYLENYYLALSQANYTGGFPRAGFFPTSTSNLNNIAFGVDVKDPFVPKFPVLNGVNIYDPGQYALGYASNEKDGIFERDAVGDISLNKQYSLGSHSSSIEVGFKGWDARKTQLFDRENFATNSQPMTDFLSNFKDNNYYFRNFTYGPVTNFSKVLATLQPGGTSPNLIYNLQNDFDISERIWAGYAMNTINLGNLRLQAGVRVESTADSLRANNVVLDPGGNL